MLIVHTHSAMQIYTPIKIYATEHEYSTLAIKLNLFCLPVGALTLSQGNHGLTSRSLQVRILRLGTQILDPLRVEQSSEWSILLCRDGRWCLICKA
jgi:hypothetical protein